MPQDSVEDLPAGLNNLMAVQALFPLAREDEMLGDTTQISPSWLPDGHASLPNEIAQQAAGLDGYQKIRAVHTAIMSRLWGTSQHRNHWQQKYVDLFKIAYPGRSVGDFDITFVANVLSHSLILDSRVVGM